MGTIPYRKIIDTPAVITGVVSSGGIWAGFTEHLPTIVLIVSLILGLLNIAYLLYKWIANWRGWRPWKK